jgi:hypothetical protein
VVSALSLACLHPSRFSRYIIPSRTIIRVPPRPMSACRSPSSKRRNVSTVLIKKVLSKPAQLHFTDKIFEEVPATWFHPRYRTLPLGRDVLAYRPHATQASTGEKDSKHAPRLTTCKIVIFVFLSLRIPLANRLPDQVSPLC